MMKVNSLQFVFGLYYFTVLMKYHDWWLHEEYPKYAHWVSEDILCFVHNRDPSLILSFGWEPMWNTWGVFPQKQNATIIFLTEQACTTTPSGYHTPFVHLQQQHLHKAQRNDKEERDSIYSVRSWQQVLLVLRENGHGSTYCNGHGQGRSASLCTTPSPITPSVR